MKSEHTFYLGDSLEILKKVRKESVQLVVTSPPYWKAKDYNHKKQLGYYDTYKQYLSKLKKIINLLEKKLLPDGKIALNIGNIYQPDTNKRRYHTINLVQDIWSIFNRNKSLKFMGTIYWKKTTSRNGAVLFGSYPYPSNFMISTAIEPIHIFRKIGKRKVELKVKQLSKISKKEFRELRDPIWNLNGISKKEHPAVFPNALVRRLIKMYSFVGDTVLDPFAGVGTTNIEAASLNRSSIGIEINKSYLNKTIQHFEINSDLYNLTIVNNGRSRNNK
jgi:DNA modification methylase